MLFSFVNYTKIEEREKMKNESCNWGNIFEGLFAYVLIQVAPLILNVLKQEGSAI